MLDQNEFSKEIEEEKYKIINDEKIRELYNKMVLAIDPKNPKLDFLNLYIKFELYKNHMEIMLIKYEEGYEKLSLLIFQDLFEEDDHFSLYTKEKEIVIEQIISVIKNEKAVINMSSMNIRLCQNNKELKDIHFLLTFFEIDLKYIYVIMIHLNIRGKELKNLIEFLEIGLKELYPNSKIELAPALETQMSSEEFLEQLVNLFEKEKNYFTDNFVLTYDNKEKRLIFVRESNEDIIKKLEDIEDKKKKKNKKKKLINIVV